MDQNDAQVLEALAEHQKLGRYGFTPSLSIKAAILAATLGEGELLISRDAHKSVSSGLVLSPSGWSVKNHINACSKKRGQHHVRNRRRNSV